MGPAVSIDHDRRQHGLHDLPQITQGTEVRFRPGQLSEAHQRLMETLGVKVVFDSHAPAECGHE